MFHILFDVDRQPLVLLSKHSPLNPKNCPPATAMPLPDTPLCIHGGCNCRAIRYEVNIPTVSERPWHPYSEETVHLPFLALRHCKDCRCATGTLVPAFACMPTQFVRISLLQRSSPPPPLEETRIEQPNDDAERHWVSAAQVFKPSHVFEPPRDSYVAYYKSIGEYYEDVLRALWN